MAKSRSAAGAKKKPSRKKRLPGKAGGSGSAQTSEILQVLGANLKAHRKRAGLRQADLAEQAGMNINHLGSIERGEENVTIGTLDKLCAVLNVPLSVLLTPQRDN